ncbi:septum formation initiator family protein [uncultured Fusobacterium sp.]|jgi:cell division protein FtsB|uniref:septum formation initiator family protein n=1 Tax=uncultured Fusobacterium sp. TaxID=159267 RepID=UPI0025DAC9DB|nr:septum formation initiator family protein [uncultured Fusobacterium sp.]MCF2640029.1 septum formation initiator family protein [Fusobacterium varium]
MNKSKIFCIVILLGVFYLFLPQIYRSYVKINKLNNEKKMILEKIQLEKNRIEEYNNSISALENDFKREQISRDRLQMVKEGEEIYRLINQK